MNVFVFDIETVPDTQMGRQYFGLDDELSDRAIADAMLSLAKQSQGTPFVKLHHHRIVAISYVFRHNDSLKMGSIGDASEPVDELNLVKRFFAGIDKYKPTLVSWNGTGFDLPVLHYRALKHGIEAAQYWESGERDNNYKYNNYLNRYHTRHIDLMDVLAAYQSKANAKLNDVAVMLGLPGKLGMSGDGVMEAYFQHDIVNIRRYCEIDVINTYLIYLHFQRMRGLLNLKQFYQEQSLILDALASSNEPHYREFISLWEPEREKD